MLERLISLLILCSPLQARAEASAQVVVRNETRLKAQAEASQPWWKSAVFYQIYLPSFLDSNGDGVGDFNGLSSRIDYLKWLGVNALWISPFLKSPKVDNGYDVSDYFTVDPSYGTNADFQKFLNHAHTHGIRVVMDMVLNHTSTENAWFKEAESSASNPFRQIYIWRDTPNNWLSYFGGSAWELSPQTKQYYYHKFDRRMADLNWSNPEVLARAQGVLKFWLDQGVDGFRFDVVNYFTTDTEFRDNPDVNGEQVHLYDRDQPDVKGVIAELKRTVSAYKDKFTVGEVGSEDLAVLSGYQSSNLLDTVFNFNLSSLSELTRTFVADRLRSTESAMPGLPTLFFGNHDMPRLFNRLAEGDIEKAKMIAALTLTARGIPFIYYGDEIGMSDLVANDVSEIRDIQALTAYQESKQAGMSDADALNVANSKNRDKARSPMQWNAWAGAGFSNAKPWLKISKDYQTVNVERERGDRDSMLSFFHSLLRLRSHEPALQHGEFDLISTSNDLLVFTRTYRSDKITAVFNFGHPTVFKRPHGAWRIFGSENLKSRGVLLLKEKF